MTVSDLQERFGEMIPLDQLAAYFHAHQRAMRAELEQRGVPIYTLGSSTVVPVRLVERAFDLAELAADEELLRHDAARWRAMYHADGAPKTVREYAREVAERAPRWRQAVDRARRQAR